MQQAGKRLVSRDEAACRPHGVKDDGNVADEVASSLCGSPFRRLSTPFHRKHTLCLHGIKLYDSCLCLHLNTILAQKRDWGEK